MKPSATGAISAKAQEMRAQGIHVYTFAAGDPVLPNHPILLEAARSVLEDGMSPYAPIAGLTELRKAASDWMNKRYKSAFAVEETVVTNGGKFAIYAALQVLLEADDEVLIQAPYWVSYPEMVRLANGNPVVISTHWKLTPELLKKHLTKRSRILILNNACNPTGILYSREEIEGILRVAQEANLLVISDEVYSELVFDGEFVSCASFPEHRSRVIVIESCSKNFAMAGWRVGFAFGPKDIISKIIALQSQSTTGTSFLSQKVAQSALKHANQIASYVKEAMAERRKIFFETYNRLFGTSIEPPPAALYFFTKMEKIEEILEKAHVALVPGSAFGMEGYARFAFTESTSEIVKGLEALAKIN